MIGGGPAPDGEWIRSEVEQGAFRPGTRGLIVAGAGCGRPDAVTGLATALGWPVLVDPRSGLRRIDAGLIGAADGILRSEWFAESHLPDVVLRLGGRWVSKVVNSFVSRAVREGAHYLAVDPWGRWDDPDREVRTVLRTDPTRLAEEVTAAITSATDSGSWLVDWQAAESQARTALATALGPAALGGGLTEPSLAHRLVEALPDGATLVVSSSMPIRDVESYAAPRRQPPRVLANRGANGIDGVVSTALGVALAGGGPTIALVGDLAFLHDVSALVAARTAEVDLVVVVADNRGGGIFSFLPQATGLDPTTFDTLFGTPQGPDPAVVAAAFGWPVDEVAPGAGSEGLEGVLARRMAAGGRSVIRVQLPDRTANVELHQQINSAVVRAVDHGGGAVPPASAQQGRGS